MSGDEHERTAVGKAVDIVAGKAEHFFKLCIERTVVFDAVDYPIEGIDDGVACNGDMGIVDVFLQQVLTAECCRSEVVGSDAAGNLAVHLFGPRAEDVVRAESGFYVSNGDLLIECGEGGGCAGCCVAVDEHNVGLRFTQHVAHACKHAGSDIIEILSLLHDVEVEVGADVEDVKHLVEHLAVLTGDADNGLECIGMFLELLDKRRHLNGLRTGPENEHDFFHS